MAAPSSTASMPGLVRALLSSVNEAVIVRGPEGSVVECNEAAERLFGLTRAQLLGRDAPPPGWRATLEDGTPVSPDDTPGMRTRRTGVGVKGVPLIVHLADGTLRWLEVTTTPVPEVAGPDGMGVVIALADVTEARTAKELALVNERRIEAMLEHSDGGVFEVDFQHGYVARSHHLYRMLGFVPGGIGATFNHWRQHVHDEDLPRVAAAWDDVERGRAETLDLTYRMRHRAGHWLWIRVRARVTRKSHAGVHQRASGTVQNITERVELERRLEAALLRIAELEGTHRVQ